VGVDALPDLRALWSRFDRPDHFDALAWAFVPAASPGAEAFLLDVLRDDDRGPLERAFALVALGRMADPAEDPLLARFGRDFNPYANVAPTLRGLARYGDAPFLR